MLRENDLRHPFITPSSMEGERLSESRASDQIKSLEEIFNDLTGFINHKEIAKEIVDIIQDRGE